MVFKHGVGNAPGQRKRNVVMVQFVGTAGSILYTNLKENVAKMMECFVWLGYDVAAVKVVAQQLGRTHIFRQDDLKVAVEEREGSDEERDREFAMVELKSCMVENEAIKKQQKDAAKGGSSAKGGDNVVKPEVRERHIAIQKAEDHADNVTKEKENTCVLCGCEKGPPYFAFAMSM